LVGGPAAKPALRPDRRATLARSTAVGLRWSAAVTLALVACGKSPPPPAAPTPAPAAEAPAAEPAPAPAAAASPTVGGPTAAAEPPAAPTTATAAPVQVVDGQVKLSGLGKSGRFRFTVTFPVPKVGELFSALSTVYDPRTGRPLGDGKFALDATMPEHGHGMMTKPEHRHIEGDQWRTDGMKLHMPGKWQIEVQFSRGDESDAATFDWEQPAEAER
jgi:hypothetical protein